MNRRYLFYKRSILLAFMVLMLGVQSIFGQDSSTSVQYNTTNYTLSGDRKTISFDVYIQDIDPTYQIAVPAFAFRMTIPQSDIGTNGKIVTVTNPSIIGAIAPTMTTSGTNWLVKFNNDTFNPAMTYGAALLVSESGLGTRVGTFNIQNADGTLFSNPQTFNTNFSGTTMALKSTVAIFLLNTITLAPNSGTAIAATKFTGLGSYSLSVAKTPLTISGVTASDKVYDGTTTAALTGGTLVGIATGDVVTLVPGTGAFADKNADSGKTVTATGYTLGGADAGKYSLSAQPSGIIANITAAPLIITGLTASDKVYNGTTAATLAGTPAYSGLQNSETFTVTGTGTAAFVNATSGTTKSVIVTGYTAPSPNYTVSQPAGITASITKVPLTIAAAAQSVPYGTAVATVTGAGSYAASGFVNSETASVITGTSTYTTTYTATTAIGTSGVTITPNVTGLSATNYSFIPVNGTITITKATSTVAATGATTYTYSGLAQGPATSTVTGSTGAVTYTYSGTGSTTYAASSTKPSAVGTYQVVASVAADANYNAGASTAYAFTITKATSTVTANGTTAYTYSGLVQGPATSTVTGSTGAVTYTYSGTGSTTYAASSTKPTAAGTYQVVASVAADVNYNAAASVAYAFTINKAILTITAVAQSVPYGTAVATVTGTGSYAASGLLNSETASVITGTPTYATTYTATTAVGTSGVTITPNVTGLSAANYSFTAASGSITITSATSTSIAVTGATTYTYSGLAQGPATSTVTGSTGAVTYTYSGTGSTTYAASSTKPSAVGTYQVIASVAADVNYNAAASVAYAFAINKAASTVTANGTTAYTYSGLVQGPATSTVTGSTGAVTYAYSGTGSTTYAASSTKPSAAGTYQVVASVAADVNYNAAISAASAFTINKAVLTITAAAQSVPYGTSVATVTGAGSYAASGLLNSETASVITGTPTYTTTYTAITAVGTPGVTITPSVTGLSAANYSFIVAAGSITITSGIATQLTVTAPTILSKVYDGTSTANVVLGTLAGVAAADVANVSVLPISATYDDANAGTGKAVTVKYVLSGSAASKYTIASEQTYSDGVIVRKQLSISNVAVVNSKTVDGNTMAVISSQGNLQGVLAVDNNNVSVKAFANYDNASVGVNKTITLTYTLTGVAKDNYIAPKDSVVTNAVIIDNIILSQLGALSAGCVGSDMELTYNILKGVPTQYKLTFDAAAHTAGIQDVVYTDLPSSATSGTISFAIPGGMADGVYQGALVIRDAFGAESSAYAFNFTVNVSADYIVQIYNDVVTCDNKSNRFGAYQWYKDGVAISGATKQFYSESNGLNGSYSVRLTTTDGRILYTCPKEFTSSSSKKVSAYPNPVKSNQAFTVEVDGFENQELENSTLSVYTIQGTCVYQSTKVEKLNMIDLPLLPQLYIGHIKANDGSDYVFKVIVEK